MATPPENVDATTTVAEDAAPAGRQDITPRQLMIVVGVLVVVLLGLVYFFFLRGGDEEAAEAPPTAEGVPAPEDPAEEEPADDDDDGSDEGTVETFEVFAPRDPFDPLVSDTEGGGVPDSGGGGGPVAGGDGIDRPAARDPGQTIGTHRVRVVDVFEQYGSNQAQIQVDGTVYTVAEGETFADNFRLVSASGRCATILFGDDEFTLCEGEEILK